MAKVAYFKYSSFHYALDKWKYLIQPGLMVASAISTYSVFALLLKMGNNLFPVLGPVYSLGFLAIIVCTLLMQVMIESFVLANIFILPAAIIGTETRLRFIASMVFSAVLPFGVLWSVVRLSSEFESKIITLQVPEGSFAIVMIASALSGPFAILCVRKKLARLGYRWRAFIEASPLKTNKVKDASLVLQSYAATAGYSSSTSSVSDTYHITFYRDVVVFIEKGVPVPSAFIVDGGRVVPFGEAPYSFGMLKYLYRTQVLPYTPDGAKY